MPDRWVGSTDLDLLVNFNRDFNVIFADGAGLRRGAVSSDFKETRRTQAEVNASGLEPRPGGR